MPLSPQTHAIRAFAGRRVKAAAGDHEPSRRAPAAGNHTFATANQTLTEVDARLTEVDATLTKVDARLTKLATVNPRPQSQIQQNTPKSQIRPPKFPQRQLTAVNLSRHTRNQAPAPRRIIPEQTRTNLNKPEQIRTPPNAPTR